jgi:Topoisomerase DNA binding C4 zinc finger
LETQPSPQHCRSKKSRLIRNGSMQRGSIILKHFWISAFIFLLSTLNKSLTPLSFSLAANESRRLHRRRILFWFRITCHIRSMTRTGILLKAENVEPVRPYLSWFDVPLAARFTWLHSCDMHRAAEKNESPTAPACSACGETMVLRTARRGPNAGGKFWGCSAYPACKGIREV